MPGKNREKKEIGATHQEIITDLDTEGIFMLTASSSTSESKDTDKGRHGKWKASGDEFKGKESKGGDPIGKKARQEAREARPRAHQHRQDKNRGPQEAIATPPGSSAVQVRSDGRTNYGRTMGGEGSLDPNSA